MHAVGYRWRSIFLRLLNAGMRFGFFIVSSLFELLSAFVVGFLPAPPL